MDLTVTKSFLDNNMYKILTIEDIKNNLATLKIESFVL